MSANRDRSRSRSPKIAMTCSRSDTQSPWQIDAAFISRLNRTPKCAETLRDLARQITTELCLFRTEYTHNDQLQTAFEMVAGDSEFARNQTNLDFRISILQIGELLGKAAKSLDLEITRLHNEFLNETSAEARKKINKSLNSLKRAQQDLKDAARLCERYKEERENCTKESLSASAPAPKISPVSFLAGLFISHQYVGPHAGPALFLAAPATLALSGLVNLVRPRSRPDDAHHEWRVKLANEQWPHGHTMQISRSEKSARSPS